MDGGRAKWTKIWALWVKVFSVCSDTLDNAMQCKSEVISCISYVLYHMFVGHKTSLGAIWQVASRASRPLGLAFKESSPALEGCVKILAHRGTPPPPLPAWTPKVSLVQDGFWSVRRLVCYYSYFVTPVATKAILLSLMHYIYVD